MIKKITLIFIFVFTVSRGFGETTTQSLKDSLSFFEGKKKAETLLTIANLYLPVNYDSALVYADEALNEYQKVGYEKGIASSYGLIGTIFGQYEMYDTAIALHHHVIEWGEQSNDIRIYISYLHLANIYELLEQTTKAKVFYLKAITGHYIPAKRAAFANMGLIFLHSNEYDSATFYFNGALNEYLKTDTSLNINKYNIATLFMNLASVDFEKNNINNGMKKLSKSLVIFQKINNSTSTALVYLKLGKGYELMNEPVLALNQYLKAEEIAVNNNLSIIRKEVYHMLFVFYRNEKEYEKALTYHKQYEKLRDSLDIEGLKKNITELEVKYALKEKIRKIESLKKEKSIIYFHATALILALLFLSIIIILFLNNRRLKLKNEKSISENKSFLAKHRADQAVQELNMLKASLHEKSTFIEELEKEISSLSNKDDQKHMEEKVKFLRKTRILTDDDWSLYSRVFYELNPTFDKKIEGFETMSQGDKRQLIFLKLGLSQKEIAYLMGISNEGVKRARQRLAKKIGLESSSNLNEFIQSI